MKDAFRKRLPGEEPNKEARAQAHEEVDKGKRYKQIIDILEESGPMTAKEIAMEMFRRGEIPTSERNFSAPRLTEMQQRGVVEPIGKRKCRWTDKTVTVYGLLGEEQLSLFREVEKVREGVR